MREDNQIPVSRRHLENLGIACLVLLAGVFLFLALDHVLEMKTSVFGILEQHHVWKTVMALVFVLLVWKLYQRYFFAWVFAMAMLLLELVENIAIVTSRSRFLYLAVDHVPTFLFYGLIGAEALLLGLFLWCRGDFCRKNVRGRIPELSSEELEQLRGLVLQYGQNPGSYLSLERDKTIYFGKQVKGVIAYGVVGDVVVAYGDPICAPEAFEALLKEFQRFCHDNIYQCVFLSVTDRYLKVYDKLGYGRVKCGEEPRIQIQSFSLAGKTRANIRAEVNHGIKDGLVVEEYEPLKERSPQVEAEFWRITDQWLQEKGGQRLTFTLGEIDFDHTADQRYFLARTKEGRMVGMVVFLPFAAVGENLDPGRGYLADIIRRAADAPRSVTETIMHAAILKFQEEGAVALSLGLAPLARMEENTVGEKGSKQAKAISHFFHYIYEHLNRFYGFKNLYKAKEKYGPEEWVPGYFVFDPKLPSAEMAYAVLDIQTPGGILDYMKKKLERKTGRETPAKQSN